MLRLFVVSFLLFLIACSNEQVIDLEQLETDARGGDPQAVEQIVELLADREKGIADRVYPVIVEIGPRAVPVLLTQVQSADKQVREYVIAALGTLKVIESVPAISNVLASQNLERRYVAAWALGEIGTKECLAPLVGALNDSNSEVRRYATRALIKLNQLAVQPLINYLNIASGEGAAGAIRALGDIADKQALDALLAHARTEQRAEAFLALGKLRDPKAESVLIAGLEDAEAEARMNAAMALGPLGGDAAAKALGTTLEDDVHVVREWSARSLEMITGRPVLYRNSHNEYVRPYQVYH
jgi:HEAT repeat protein